MVSLKSQATDAKQQNVTGKLKKTVFMKYRLLIAFIIFSFESFGQNVVFDTSVNEPPIVGEKYYSKTDFSKIDSLQYWKYKLNMKYHGTETDTLKPIGQIIFLRTKTINDGISKKLYGRDWNPNITFDIFNVADSLNCFKNSTRIRFFSSCVPPQVGGDIIIVGKFLFLNRSVCLSCQRYDSKIDYCRPVLNYIFSNIRKREVETVEELVQQFPILSE